MLLWCNFGVIDQILIEIILNYHGVNCTKFLRPTQELIEPGIQRVSKGLKAKSPGQQRRARGNIIEMLDDF